MTYLRDCLAWAWCWVCYRLALIAPLDSWLWWATLANAGTYAHLTFAEFRDQQARRRRPA